MFDVVSSSSSSLAGVMSCSYPDGAMACVAGVADIPCSEISES